MTDFLADFTGMSESLAKVSDVIHSSIVSQNPIINDALSLLFASNGKMLRPGLLLIASQFGSAEEDKTIHLAAALEMLHAATLIHDDIIDDSPLRRGLPTVQSRYGKKDAVLIGDFLLSRSFLITAEYASPEQALQLAKIVSIICTMEIEQNTNRFCFDRSIRQYFRKIMGKTALLFSLACHVGAHEANVSRSVAETLRRAGYNIGMAFQIIDDILDYSGDETLVRKPLGIDLKSGIITLPLISALRKDTSGKLSELCNIKNIHHADFDGIINMVKNLGGIESAGNHARKFTNRALQEIMKLPSSNSRDLLEQLTNRLLVRSY